MASSDRRDRWSEAGLGGAYLATAKGRRQLESTKGMLRELADELLADGDK